MVEKNRDNIAFGNFAPSFLLMRILDQHEAIKRVLGPHSPESETVSSAPVLNSFQTL